jgi:hypothetical protein
MNEMRIDPCARIWVIGSLLKLVQPSRRVAIEKTVAGRCRRIE